MKTIHMQYKKSTKGTHVYEEVSETGGTLKSHELSIPSLYIRRNALPDNAPESITVKVDW